MSVAFRVVTAVVATVAMSGVASATTHNFNYTFDGTTITQDAGSDTADGTVLNIGDEFIIDLTAEGDAFWKVNSLFNDFVPLSYLISDSATRTASITTSWLLDGVVQDSLVESTDQSFSHVGAQSWNLASGLMFDEVILSWTFDAIDNAANTVISATSTDFFEPFGDSENPFFRAPEISYEVAAIPLPATLPLLVGAVGFLGFARRRRAA